MLFLYQILIFGLFAAFLARAIAAPVKGDPEAGF